MAKSKWVEFSILVEQELAEAIAGTLSGIVPGGIVQERVFSGIFPEKLNQEWGPVRVFGYLPNDDQLDQRRERISEALFFLGKITPLPEPTFSQLMEQDWTTVWQERYRPIPLGTQLMIVPSWLDSPDPDRIAISIDPAMAFGSGTHPTTQMSLIFLEEVLRKRTIPAMFDIGCGTGIISIAAAKLGVNEVIGVDIDPDAIKISKANAKNNQVGDKTVFFQGSIDEILQGAFRRSQTPLIVANIITPILTGLIENGLVEILSQEGFLILSGILEDQLCDFKQILGEFPLDILSERQQGDWIALLCARRTS
jgi:ribosomal protein L11 methyltransferase